MDPFLSLYTNRHSLPFSTPYSTETPSIPNELISNSEMTQINDINTSKKRKHQDIIPIITLPKNENTDEQDVKFESLSKSRKELLTWHHKLNLVNIKTVQDLARSGFLP
eukprot:15335280-Ditylum_brightwellii.AAC.1